MRLGCASALLARLPLGEALDAIAAAGYDDVDLWAVPGQCEHVRLEDDPAAVRFELDRAGLGANALSIYGARGGRLDAGLEWAARAGVPRVVFESFGPDFESFLGPYAECAAELGVEICVENHIDCPVDTIASAAALLGRFPSVTLAYAPIHTEAVGESVTEALRELGPRIGLLYAWDVPAALTGEAWLREHWHRTGDAQLPGSGRLDFAALAPLLPDAPRSLCAHGTADWATERITGELVRSRAFLAASGWL